MVARRQEAMKELEKDEFLLTLTNFPRLGCSPCIDPDSQPTPQSGASLSIFLSDQVINAHARFP